MAAHQAPRPWDSLGKNTGVGCHFLLQFMKVKSESDVAQSCLTLSNPMDRSLPGSSVHGIFQARGLEWVAIAFSERRILSSTKSVVSLLLFIFQDYLAWTQRKPETQNTYQVRTKRSQEKPSPLFFPESKEQEQEIVRIRRTEEIPRTFSLVSFPGHQATLRQQQKQQHGGSWAGSCNSVEVDTSR